MFLACPRLTPLLFKLGRICEKIGFSLRLTYKTLLFGHKVIYPAYTSLNDLLSYIFYAIYKHWLHNNMQTDIGIWLHSHLLVRLKIYKDLNDKKYHTQLTKVLQEW